MVQIGYKLMTEEHGPRALLENAKRAEQLGFDFVAISDHYLPWVDAQGHAPFAWSVLGAIAASTERIGIATSKDMVSWRRYGSNHVLANGEDKRNGMSADPQVVRMGDLWVMFYFGAGWKPKAFDTFAVSRDLVNWTKWDGPHLVEPSEPWDETYAHKPWVLKHDGVVYHYYCAVGKEGRVIALATSKDLRTTVDGAR